MRVIKVLYNKKSEFIINIVNKFKDGNIIEYFNGDLNKDLKKIRPIQTRLGTKNYPLVVFEDENLFEVAAIWPESSPDWEKEISKYLENGA